MPKHRLTKMEKEKGTLCDVNYMMPEDLLFDQAFLEPM